MPSYPRLPLSKVFFYILVFCIPFGTGRVFFTETSFLGGNFIFYNSWAIYLTDFLICALILAWIIEKATPSLSPPLQGGDEEGVFHSLFTDISHDKLYISLGIFWLVSALSLIVSRETWLGFYGLVKISEFILLFAYIRENVSLFHVKSPVLSQSDSGDKFVSRETLRILGVFCVSLGIQALIGIFQYFSQGSLGLKILGESVLVPGWKGIAVFITKGLVNPLLASFSAYLSNISSETYIIRAYGTLPHANVFGAFMYSGLLFGLLLNYRVSRETNKIWRIFAKLLLVLCVFGVIFSFSRTIWLVSLLSVIFWFLIIYMQIRKHLVQNMQTGKHDQDFAEYFPGRVVAIAATVFLTVGVCLFIFGPQIKDRLVEADAQSFSTQQSYVERSQFNSIALAMIRERPVLGVGVKNFVARMQDFSGEKLRPELFQPVHNIYLLIAAESGVVALAAVLFFFLNIVRHVIAEAMAGRHAIFNFTLLTILGGFFLIGLFDHYLWTIQQGSLALWVALGLLSAKQKTA